MTAWVALLRGVNVGGITVKSADLRAMLAGLGYENVRTYLASGNASFDSSDARATVKPAIEKALRARFGYDAWIVLVTRTEIERAIAGFPFDADDETRQPWVVFCVDKATCDRLTDAAASLDAAEDPVAPGADVVYWSPVKGTTTDTPFGKLLGRAAFKAATTTRNLRTLQKIVA